MEARQNSLYRRKDIYSKQQEAQGENPIGELWYGGCKTSRITKDDGAAQMELVVARVKGRYQEICSGMLQISTEQSPTSEEIGRTTSISSLQMVDLVFLYFILFFIFILFSYFSIFRT